MLLYLIEIFIINIFNNFIYLSSIFNACTALTLTVIPFKLTKEKRRNEDFIAIPPNSSFATQKYFISLSL